jgi:hypothetical protein
MCCAGTNTTTIIKEAANSSPPLPPSPGQQFCLVGDCCEACWGSILGVASAALALVGTLLKEYFGCVACPIWKVNKMKKNATE